MNTVSTGLPLATMGSTTAVRANSGYPYAEMWSFCLASDHRLNENLGLKDAREILRGYFTCGETISPVLSTRAIHDEIRRSGLTSKYGTLLHLEKELCLPRVEELFTVIASDTRIAVVDETIVEGLKQGAVDWRMLQRKSVRIPGYKLDELRVTEVLPGIYVWNLPYDKDLIGYMAGIIQNTSFDGGRCI